MYGNRTQKTARNDIAAPDKSQKLQLNSTHTPPIENFQKVRKQNMHFKIDFDLCQGQPNQCIFESLSRISL